MFLYIGTNKKNTGNHMNHKLNELILKEIETYTNGTSKTFLTYTVFHFYFFCVNIKLKHTLFVPLKREIY